MSPALDANNNITACIDAPSVQAALQAGTVTQKQIVVLDLYALAAIRAAAGSHDLANAIAAILAELQTQFAT